MVPVDNDFCALARTGWLPHHVGSDGAAGGIWR